MSNTKQPIYAELPADRYSKSGNVTDTGWYNIHDMRAFADATHALRTQALAAQAPQQAAPAERVHGDVLPPVGSRVYIRHGRDDDAHACTVTGYYAWGDLKGDKRLHRLFVRLVYEGTNTEQARMLCDCYPTAEAALAIAAPQQEAVALLPEHLTLAVDQWFAQNTGLGGCSDKDVAQLAAIFYGVTYDGGRESVDDALAVVESFGPGIEGLNDTYARQVILAQEVLRLHGECMRSMESHQTTRNALRAALDHIDMNALRISHCKDAAAIDAAQAYRQVAPAMPPGWVPCTIEFDGSGPEEVAYGPKIMMDRLAKWLGKHFERTIAEKAAPQVQKPVNLYPGCSRWGFKSDTAQPAPSGGAWKDGDTAALVNELRDVALQYRDTQQLRERIAHIVRPLSARVAPSGDAWTPVAERLPEPQTPVLLDIGKKYPIRAMWVPKGTLPVGWESDTGFGEYDEGKDEYFCPEGWYEWNQHEECHWNVSEKPLAWMALPELDAARKEGK